MRQQLDEQQVRTFAGKLLGIYTGAMLTFLVDIGNRTGLFDTAARAPGTSRELAERAGLQERYVREWLGAMTASGIVGYDPASGVYSLSPEHAAVLTGNAARNLAPQSQFINALGSHVAEVARCFRDGGGVPYAAFRPDFTQRMEDLWRRIYDGYDIGPEGIVTAGEEAGRMGLANVLFEMLDVARLPAEPKFDLITALDAIHDQVAPVTALQRVAAALAPDGIFFMVDFKFASKLEDNLANPFAPLYYGVSTLHCMTVSLAEGGAGLGTVWGEQLARQMLADAGFASVQMFDSPRPQNCIYVCRRG